MRTSIRQIFPLMALARQILQERVDEVVKKQEAIKALQDESMEDDKQKDDKKKKKVEEKKKLNRSKMISAYKSDISANKEIINDSLAAMIAMIKLCSYSDNFLEWIINAEETQETPNEEDQKEEISNVEILNVDIQTDEIQTEEKQSEEIQPEDIQNDEYTEEDIPKEELKPISRLVNFSQNININ